MNTMVKNRTFTLCVLVVSGVLIGAEANAQADQPIDLDALRDATTTVAPPQTKGLPVIGQPDPADTLPSVGLPPATEAGTSPTRVFPSAEELNARLVARLAQRQADTLAEACALIVTLGIALDTAFCQGFDNAQGDK